MTRVANFAVVTYARLTRLFPGEFRRRHCAEMQLDFADDVDRCATAAALGVAVARAYQDLLVSVAREWWTSESLRILVYAGLVHAGIWLTGVAIAAWQWPGGSPLYPVVLTFAVLGEAGIVLTVWRQRLHAPRVHIVR